MIASGFAFNGAAWAQDPVAAAPAKEGQTMQTVTVTGKTNGKPASTVGSKLPAADREIPQSVSVTTRERIEAQNLYTLEDALRHTGGITIERIDSNRLNIYSRGFEITTLLLDGLPTTMDDRVFASPDLAMIERVEVLKGPAGLNGAAGPGGSVNLVRKRPQTAFGFSGTLGAGSWDHYVTEADVTGALNESGSLRGRAVAAYRHEGLFLDNSNRKKGLLYGVLEADLAPGTVLSLGASHQDVQARVPWTLPAYTDFRLLDVPRSTYLGADWNREHYKTTSAFAELEHKFAGGWSAKLALRHVDGSVDYRQGYAWGAVDPATRTTDLWALWFAYDQQQTGLDAYAGGPFSLFGRTHQALVGVNVDRSVFRRRDYIVDPADPQADFLATVDVFNPISNVREPAFVPDVFDKTVTDQQGIYGNVRFSLADPLALVLGGRVGWWDSTTKTELPAGLADSTDKIDAKFTPFAGLIYDLNRTTSLYTSYAAVFQPHRANFRDAGGNLLKPLQGHQVEAGVKTELLDGALAASAALFQIEQENRALQVIAPPLRWYEAQGKAESRGVELGLVGRLRPGWDVHAEYTYTQTKKRDASVNTGSALTAIAPRHILQLWTHYRLPGELNRWSLSGAVNARSRFYNEFTFAGTPGRLQQGGYATVDARVAYQVTNNVSVDLAVTNLFDKVYYQRINNLNSGNLFGDPRAFMLSLRTKI